LISEKLNTFIRNRITLFDCMLRSPSVAYRYIETVYYVMRRRFDKIQNKSSSGHETPERDVSYIVLYDYLFTTLLHLYFRCGILF